MSEDTTWNTGLDDTERFLERHADKALTAARDLQRWYLPRGVDRDAYDETFELSKTLNRADDTSFGFFGETDVAGHDMAIMGCFQQQFFDHARAVSRSKADRTKAAKAQRDQMREFVLRYFMRVSDFRGPSGLPQQDRKPTPPYLRPFTLCPQDNEAGEAGGFGFEQVLYKRKNGRVGRFIDGERFEIKDLREMAAEYEWVIVKVDIFGFKFEYKPFGPSSLYGTLPLGEASYLIIAPDLLTHVDNETNADERSDGELGRYGFGYGFLPSAEDGVLAYGPGRFDAAWQEIVFHVDEDGNAVVRMGFVANRPRKVVNISADPVSWAMRFADLASFGMARGMMEPMRSGWRRAVDVPDAPDLVQTFMDVANRLTGNYAERELCVAKKQLEKQFLVQHFAQHYAVIAGALSTWRSVSDWTGDDVPLWARTGASI